MRRRGLFRNKREGGGFFPTDGLVALYNMEGNALDSYGTQDGVNNGAEAVDGKLGTALRFITPDTVTVSGFSGITTAASVNMWISLNLSTPSVGGASGLMSLNTSDLMSHYPFTNGIIYLDLLTSVRKEIGTGIVADRTKWHMVTVTADTITNEWKFYQNAQLVHTSTVGTLNINSTLTFGKSSGSAWLSGKLQVIPLYSRALSISEIEGLYNEGNGIKL